MFSTLFVVDAFIAVALGVLGLLVLRKNSQVFLNRLFFLFVTTIALWIMSNYYSNDLSLSLGAVLWANHFTLFFPGLSMAMLLMFAGVLTGRPFYRKYGGKIALLCTVVSFTAFTPWVIEGVHRQGDVYAITFGVLSPAYFLALAVPVGMTIGILLRAIKHSKGVDRTRFQTIFLTVITAVVVNLFTNAVVPYFGGSFALTNLGPISIILVVGGLFYAIIRHRLFDIRAVVARSLVYLFTLSALGMMYALVAFLFVGKIIYGDTALSGGRQLLLALLAAITAFVFQPVLHFFNRATTRFFYKAGYDSQVFLDKLNKLLVASFGLDNLLNNASQTIADTLKLGVCSFLVYDPSRRTVRIVGVHKFSFTPQELKLFERELQAQNGMLIMTDFIEHQSSLKKLLNSKEIALVSVLHANTVHEPVLGYLVLGLKKNGNPYTSQDTKLIEIISSELVIAIQNNLRYEEIQKFNATLEQKVEDATRRLRQSNAKLKMLDQTKDDFISMASHQLRTPLTSVKGYVSMVLDGDAGKITPLQRKLLTQSFVSSQRMVYLISDLLNVSRLRTGKFIIEPTRTNLATVIKGEIEQLVETAKGRNLELVYNKPEHFPTYMMDETKLRQVIMNFIDNAIYYTPSGGKISVNLVEKPQTIEFLVIDNGMGVPKADQPHLFTKFFRAHNAKRARPDGTGLGLFMAKKVVIAQGGAVLFKSQEGKGSTFGFTFAKDKLELAP